jgi:hypothetical protein
VKIFLLGDSFTDNLFKAGYENILRCKNNKHLKNYFSDNEIVKYLIELQSINAPKALWFDDWLTEYGYDVYNFGTIACTIEDIIYQFSKLKAFDYNEGDRIILNWTHPSRFNWITDDLNCWYIHSNIFEFQNLPKELFKQQAVNREMSFFDDGYLNQNLLPFMEYIVELHSKYKPIMWTPFNDLDKKILNQKYHFSFQHQFAQEHFLSKLPKYWSIREETSHLINDGHFGQYGNYYMSVLFDEIIKSSIGPYYNNDSKIIFDKALDRIKFEKKQFITTTTVRLI